MDFTVKEVIIWKHGIISSDDPNFDMENYSFSVDV